jgi:hypothetical protein
MDPLFVTPFRLLISEGCDRLQNLVCSSSPTHGSQIKRLEWADEGSNNVWHKVFSRRKKTEREKSLILT